MEKCPRRHVTTRHRNGHSQAVVLDEYRSMIADNLSGGSRTSLLSGVDKFSLECLASGTSQELWGDHVVAVIERLKQPSGIIPQKLRQTQAANLFSP